MMALSCASKTLEPQVGDGAFRSVSYDIPLTTLDGYGDITALGYSENISSEVTTGGLDLEWRVDDRVSFLVGMFKTTHISNEVLDADYKGTDLGMRFYFVEDREAFVGFGLGFASNDNDYLDYSTVHYQFVEAGGKIYIGDDNHFSVDPYIRLSNADVYYGYYDFYDEYSNYVGSDSLTESNTTTSIGIDVSYNF